MSKSGGPGRGGRQGSRDESVRQVWTTECFLSLLTKQSVSRFFFHLFICHLTGKKLFSSFSKGEKTEWAMHFSLLF